MFGHGRFTVSFTVCTVLLVFGEFTLTVRATPGPSQIDRNVTVQRDMESFERVQARLRISFGLKHFQGTNVKEISSSFAELPIVSKALVFCTGSKRFTGLIRLINFENQTAIVQSPLGRQIFLSSIVRPCLPSVLDVSPRLYKDGNGGKKDESAGKGH